MNIERIREALLRDFHLDLSDGFLSVFDTQLGNSHNTGGFSTGDILPPPSANAPSLTIGGTGAGAGSTFALNPSSAIYQYVSDNFRMRMQLLDNTNMNNQYRVKLDAAGATVAEVTHAR